jgi:hypothetical protein
MKAIILLYKLKTGITRDDFETWVREQDYPAMRALQSVERFTSYRLEKLLMGDGTPSQQYVEVFELNSLENFIGEDMPGEIVQQIMGQFMGFAEAPEFIIAEAVE